METIYRPRGRAQEYAYLGLELYRCDASERGGCVHGCRYCYVPACLGISHAQFKRNVRLREGLLPALAKAARKWAGTDDRVLLSFFSDPCHGVSLSDSPFPFLSILRKHQIPFTILTKAPSRIVDGFPVFVDLKKRNTLGVTMTVWDETRSAKIEPGANSPRMRRKVLEAAKGRGIPTWVSLEPVLDVAETLRVIDETHDVVDQYRVGVLNHQPSKIDWRAFGQAAIDRLEKYGNAYYIKRDLGRHLRGIRYTQTDTRSLTTRVTVING